MELTTERPDGEIGTAGRILKVNHAGEFGAVNIYCAQILIGTIFRVRYTDTLKDFLAHEKKHLEIFRKELERRNVRRCRSYYLCGIGGYSLGFISGLLGRDSVLACTAAVETVVLRHLEEQIIALKEIGDAEAVKAVEAIVRDEMEHHQEGLRASTNCIFYKPFVKIIKFCTESVIWLGMRL
ncbi:MAG: demethoxyubiquinone hydroxylase family protein [Gammaproteobacteria bacterium]|nr:demethoxyubiquinone hydroxylase family protein [Gammaproteobacteria bacterium]